MAAVYEWIAAPGLARFHRGVATEAASFLARGRVLDVGTGPAHLLVALARLNPDLELVGLDLSRQMLRIARRVVARAPGMRAALVRGDVEALPFADQTFDLVVSTSSLHHWRNPARGIRECFRVTAPGGQCWICDLRTDVPVRTIAELAAGGRLRRMVSGLLFKFHGVRPEEFDAATVAGWPRRACWRSPQSAAFSSGCGSPWPHSSSSLSASASTTPTSSS